jgi:hypothetical protein
MRSRYISARLGFCSIVLLLAAVGAASAQSVSFDYSSLGSALITFHGGDGAVGFTDDVSGFAFQIADANPSGLDGLAGNISGVFTIGPIITLQSGVQEASITGSGTLSIFDGTSGTLTAAIAASGYNALTVGTVGVLNPDGTANLSDFSYTGTDAALAALAKSTSGVDTLSFQFISPESLEQIVSGGSSLSTTFSGSLVAIPEPSVAATALGGAALGFALLLRRRSGSPVG